MSATAKRLNTRVLSVSSEELNNDLNQAEETLRRKHEAIEAEKRELESLQRSIEAKKAEEKAKRDKKLQNEYEELLEDAKSFRNEAQKAADEQAKKDYLRFAQDAEKQARDIAYQLGMFSSEEQQSTQRNWKLVYLTASQVAGLLVLVAAALAGFGYVRSYIIEKNKALMLSGEQQVSYFDWDSLQKLFYEQLSRGVDFILLLGLLAIVAPSVVRYLVPIIPSERNFFTEFYEDLTPWQRTIASVTLVGSVLLYLAISHLVRP